MKTISNKITAWCARYYPMSEADCHIVAYGLECMLGGLWKFLVILSLGAVIGYFWDVLLSMFVFSSLRRCAGGYHSNTHLGCLGATMLACISPLPFLELTDWWAGGIRILMCIYALYEMIRFAPRNSEVNPIYDDQILKRKRITGIMLTGLAVMIVMFFPVTRVRWLVVCPMFAEAFTISPVCFRERKRADN